MPMCAPKPKEQANRRLGSGDGHPVDSEQIELESSNGFSTKIWSNTRVGFGWVIFLLRAPKKKKSTHRLKVEIERGGSQGKMRGYLHTSSYHPPASCFLLFAGLSVPRLPCVYAKWHMSMVPMAMAVDNIFSTTRSLGVCLCWASSVFARVWTCVLSTCIHAFLD